VLLLILSMTNCGDQPPTMDEQMMQHKKKMDQEKDMFQDPRTEEQKLLDKQTETEKDERFELFH
jgi:hypothetical protein